MAKFKASPKLKLNDVIEEERLKICVKGEFNTSLLVESVQRRLDGDLSLIGIDTHQVAQSSVRSLLEARRPDWNQPGFQWYEAGLLIPFDEDGNEVELGFAQDYHFTGYAEVRFGIYKAYMKAQGNFRKHLKWIQDNLKPGQTLETLISSQA